MEVITVIGTWKIKNEYERIVKCFFRNEEVVQIDTISNENDEDRVFSMSILLISSRCSEIERKQVYKSLSVRSAVATYIFVETVANTINIEEDVSGRFSDLFISPLSWMDSLQIPVVKHCNLNCNRCYHFSNLVKGKESYELENYKRDVADIKKLGFMIGEVRFLGGEPLLNKNLLEYIAYMHSLFPYTVLKVVTNGLLINKLSQRQCEILSQMKVVLSVSLYAPLHDRFDAVEEFLLKNNIQYELFRIGDRFDKILLKNGDSQKAESIAEQCEKCVIIYNGRIGRCAPGMFIGDFNRYFNASYPEFNDRELRFFSCSKDVLFYLDKAVPLCEWCTGDGQVESYPWSRTQNISIEDYIIDNQKF